jgi:hypothetical protein
LVPNISEKRPIVSKVTKRKKGKEEAAIESDQIFILYTEKEKKDDCINFKIY